MAKKVIRIDTYIGGWGYSKGLLRYDLEGTQDEGVVIEISSLGGSLYDALDMHNQLAQHGNAEVVITGPSASAATIIALGAKKVSIIENAFWLIHKVMSVVDNWGQFNEEELDKLIQDLQTLRTENQKFDQVIARIYQKKTGLTMDEILNIMKKDTWMTAEEAKTLGFIDEILEPDKKYNYRSDRFVAMVRGADLPELPADDQPKNNGLFNKINDMKQFDSLNRLLEVEELHSSDEGSYLNIEQLNTINAALANAEKQEGLNSQLKSELQAAVTDRDAIKDLGQENVEIIARLNSEIEQQNTTMQSLNSGIAELERNYDALNTIVNSISASVDSIDESVASAGTLPEKVAAIQLLLSKAPGAPIAGNLDDKDKQAKTKNGVDWALINALPHNQEADKIR